MVSVSHLQRPVTWTRQRFASLDLDTFCTTLAEISGGNEADVRKYYRECRTELEPLYRARYRDVPNGIAPQYLALRWKGFLMYAGLDRIALYILTRLEQPQVVYETGVLWGDGSLAVLSALEKNGNGVLHSFDAGWDVATEYYGSPPGTDELGWVVPDRFSDRWEVHVGNSLKLLPKCAQKTPPVDLFYHDSLHTYEHMIGEYRAVYPHMASGGLLMSEDTHQNDAWEDFIAEVDTQGDIRFNSHQGREELYGGGKEVAATRVD